MKNLFILSFLALGQNLWAQRADSTRVFNEQERNELGAMLHIGISGGILTNLNNQALANVRPQNFLRWIIKVAAITQLLLGARQFCR